MVSCLLKKRCVPSSVTEALPEDNLVGGLIKQEICALKQSSEGERRKWRRYCGRMSSLSDLSKERNSLERGSFSN